MSTGRAADLLHRIGLGVSFSQVPATSLPHQILVVQESPPAGTPVKPGSTVHFGLQLGPVIPMPIASPPAPSPTAAANVRSAWPRHPRVVGTITAIEPPLDDILLFKSILLHADRMACSDVTSIDTAIRVGARGTRRILVRCGDNRVRAVRLVFSGVAVPDLHPSADVGMNEPQSTLAMLGLRWHISWPSAPGRHRGASLQQEPPPGTIVPLGTVIRVVYVR